MLKMRMAAAALSMMTVMFDGLFFLTPGASLPMLGVIAIAAALLAIVAPFDAPLPPARKRVFAACLGYVATICVALGLALVTDAGSSTIAVLALLAGCGAALSLWAFRTRNRRRMSWGGYFDS